MARAAISLNTLLAQLDSLAPRRNKASDGWIGDTSHQNRTSDHNPWYPPPHGGVVTARDFTHDPTHLRGQWVADTLVTHRDPRIKYIIWNRKIWTPGAGWRAYTGQNPHTSHVHLSVVSSPLCDSATPWQGFTKTEENDMELTDKIRFWDGFEITVGQSLADTWQLANNLNGRPTRPNQPADMPPWLTKLFTELAAMRAEQVRQAGMLAAQGELMRQIAQDEELDLVAIEGAALKGAKQGVAESTIDVDINIQGNPDLPEVKTSGQ